jgi:hypothetical protein
MFHCRLSGCSTGKPHSFIFVLRSPVFGLRVRILLTVHMQLLPHPLTVSTRLRGSRMHTIKPPATGPSMHPDRIQRLESAVLSTAISTQQAYRGICTTRRHHMEVKFGYSGGERCGYRVKRDSAAPNFIGLRHNQPYE